MHALVPAGVLSSRFKTLCLHYVLLEASHARFGKKAADSRWAPCQCTNFRTKALTHPTSTVHRQLGDLRILVMEYRRTIPLCMLNRRWGFQRASDGERARAEDRLTTLHHKYVHISTRRTIFTSANSSGGNHRLQA